jgi:hypothetical protein
MQPSSPADIRHQLRARLLELPPRAFELFAGDLLTFIGLRDVVVTRYSRDGGIDATGRLETSTELVSIPTAVQVKRYQANVQRAEIDRFIGALHGQFAQGMFITTSGFSPQARQKAATVLPRITTIDGAQVLSLMLRYRLGITAADAIAPQLDEDYFGQFEAQAARPGIVAEQGEPYRVGNSESQGRPEDDLISLRALSHALRVDVAVPRRWIEQERLVPDQAVAAGRSGYLFRRDRIDAIRAELLGATGPLSPEEWRQEFLEFARSRNLSKSYKPVLLNALLDTVNRDGEAQLDTLAARFRAFYLARRQAGLMVEYGPPDVSDPHSVSDARLQQLIVRNPLERFRIKGFLSYSAADGVVRFAPVLWNELRAFDLLDLRRSVDEQLAYYYTRR